tara:strand:- start:190 stop:999 length:810 start_codon:yes stop_codon:yes gene_type:complete
MPSCRCQTLVFDNITKRYRLCKNKKKFYNFCFIHAQINYNKSATLIQSYFKAQIIRKKLKYYRLLPRDLQSKILWHMREYLYIKCLNNSILKIINKKIDSLFSSIINVILLNQHLQNYQPTINIPNLGKYEQFAKEIFKDKKCWDNNRVSNSNSSINKYNHSFYNELLYIIKLINKYSLIILHSNLASDENSHSNIYRLKYLICFIIKENKSQNSNNLKLFYTLPDQFIEFGNLFITHHDINSSIPSWKLNQSFRVGDVRNLWNLSEIY